MKQPVKIIFSGACDINNPMEVFRKRLRKVKWPVKTINDNSDGPEFGRQAPYLLQQLAIQEKKVAVSDDTKKQLCDNVWFIKEGVFSSRVFEPANVIVLSATSDYYHSIYKHRHSDFYAYYKPGFNLIDPGAVIRDRRMTRITPLSLEWFRANFEKAGNAEPEEFVSNYVHLINEIKKRSGAHIIIANGHIFDKGNLTYNYQFCREEPLRAKHMRFNLALIEVSRLTGVSILDIDRLLQMHGSEKYAKDIRHLHKKFLPFIAEELVRILEDIGFFSERPLIPQRGQDPDINPAKFNKGFFSYNKTFSI